MYPNVIQHTVHIHGTLAANATGVIPSWSNTGAKLLEVSAVSANAGDATLKIGTLTNDDAYMTAKPIGVSSAPEWFTVEDFDGVLGDALGLTCPQHAPGTVFTWTLDYDGDGGTAAAHVDLVFTLLIGGVNSDVTGLLV
jgi:hypothetical protein